MTLKSQLFSILALLPKIEWKINMSTLLNADSSIGSLAVASRILSGAAHRHAGDKISRTPKFSPLFFLTIWLTIWSSIYMKNAS